MRTALVLALASLVFVVAGSAAAPVDAPLVVATTRADLFHSDVFVVDTVTRRMRNLTRNSASDRDPAPSPDGRAIAFVSDRGGTEALWVIPAGGGPARRLSPALFRDDESYVTELLWRPDGRAVAYAWTSSTATGIGVVDRSGRIVFSRRGGYELIWLPGNRLAVNTSGGVATYGPDGRLLSRRAGFLAGATTAGRLAFVRGRSVELFDANGKRFARVAGTGGRWSPDGRLFALARGRGIALVDLEGRTRTLSRTLTLGSWSPDGRFLLATNADYRSVVVGLDGRVRSAPADAALWSPDGALAGLSIRGLVVGRPGLGSRVIAPLHYRSGCDAGAMSLRWLDRRRLVLEQGGAGQNDADLWLAGSQGRWLRRLTTSRNWDGNPAWSPDGGSVVYESSFPNTHADGCVPSFESTLRLVSASGRDLGRLTATTAREPVWSPDGKAIAAERVSLSDGNEFGLLVVDLATRRERQLSTGPAGRPTWSPDSRELAVENNGRVLVVDAASGTQRTVGPGTAPAWSPDGRTIAHLRGGRLRLVPAAGGEAVDLGPAVGALGPIRWSPDGGRLAVGTRAGIVIATPAGGRRVLDVGGRPLAWSPDGRRLLIAGSVGHYSRPAFGGSARTDLYVVPASGGRPVRLSQDLADVVGVSWRAG